MPRGAGFTYTDPTPFALTVGKPYILSYFHQGLFWYQAWAGEKLVEFWTPGSAGNETMKMAAEGYAKAKLGLRDRRSGIGGPKAARSSRVPSVRHSIFSNKPMA